MPNILVSMVAYREKHLGETVKNCLDAASNENNIFFSIVSEQSEDGLHPDLSFIPKDKLVYRKYDLSEFRGVTWSRQKTTEVDFDYDYILYTCGHNMFAQDWDIKALDALKEAEKLSDKVLITSSGPEFEYNQDWSLSFEPRSGRTANKYRPKLPGDYVPGYGFPNSLQVDVPDIDGVIEDAYIQWSFVFAPKQYVLDVPIDPKMSYHVEEIYLTIVSWSRGWRFYTTPEILYYHDTYKDYPDEETPTRMNTHRPWIDINQKAFWDHSDNSMIRFNMLMSGGLYPDVTAEKVISFCEATGMNKKYCEKVENYGDIGLERHAEGFRHMRPFLGE